MIPIPPVVGDPAGMRAFAGSLRTLAAQLSDYEAELTGLVRGMTFEGPAGTEFAERMASFGRRLADGASRLEGLAGRIMVAADRVEEEIRARERLIEELNRQMAQAAAGAGGP
jgi:uncharacterized protein YukE